jgi:heme exporter protein D
MVSYELALANLCPSIGTGMTKIEVVTTLITLAPLFYEILKDVPQILRTIERHASRHSRGRHARRYARHAGR